MDKGWKANKLGSLEAKQYHNRCRPEHSDLQAFRLLSHLPEQTISNATIQ
jgi:hypothetical protein